MTKKYFVEKCTNAFLLSSCYKQGDSFFNVFLLWVSKEIVGFMFWGKVVMKELL